MTNETNYKPCRLKCNGATKDFPFEFQVHKNEELFVNLINTDTQEATLLVEGSDYSATLEAVGGNVTTKTAYANNYVIEISRQTSYFQGKTFSTSGGFQASEIENAFDRVSCGLQDMDYNIETFKEEYSAQTNQKIEDFEDEVNSKISQVTEAVNQLHRLDEVLETCERYAVVSEEQSIIAQNQAVLAEEHALSAEQTLANIQNEHAVAIDNMQATKQQSINEIKASGIYMVGDRLFYRDKKGVEHEFRNDFGGIAPMAVKQRDIKEHEYIEEKIIGSINFNSEDATPEETAMFLEISLEEVQDMDEETLLNAISDKIAELTAQLPRENVTHKGYLLTWTDPDDSAYQDNIYVEWGNTLIVRKKGGYPESPFDGEIVVNNEVRNAYASEGYFDEVDVTKDYKYRAFPCSINRVYNLAEKNKFGFWCYAYTELLTEANPAKRISYLEDNAYYNPCYMDFTNNTFRYNDWDNSPFFNWDYIRPCMVYNEKAVDENGNNLSGQVMEWLDPNDHTKTIDGQPSHVKDKNCNANAMVWKKPIFTKRVTVGSLVTVYFSNVKLDNDYECYPCKRPDGTYADHYFTPMYCGSLVDNVLRSLSGGLTPISSKTAQNEIDYARANGTSKAYWDTEVFADIILEEDIFKLVFKNTDSQTVLGQGKSNGGSSVSACLTSGTMDTKGQNWGSSSNANGVKFRYRENFYASQWQRARGIIINKGVTMVKMTRSTIDGSTVNDYNIDGTGYIRLSDVPATSGSSGGYQSGFASNKYGTFSTVVSGSSSTYTCDGRWFDNGIVAYPYRGGNSSNGLLCGAFCWASNNASSAAGWGIGASLSCKPL